MSDQCFFSKTLDLIYPTFTPLLHINISIVSPEYKFADFSYFLH